MLDEGNTILDTGSFEFFPAHRAGLSFATFFREVANKRNPIYPVNPVKKTNIDFIFYEIIRIYSFSSKLRPDLMRAKARFNRSRLSGYPLRNFAVWVGHKYQVQIQGRVMRGNRHPLGPKYLHGVFKLAFGWVGEVESLLK